jgi:glutamine synthetase
VSHRAVLAFCREKEVKAVDLRYTEPLGSLRSLTIPVDRLTEATVEQGFGVRVAPFPGSPPVDRLLIPHPESAFLDPFSSVPTLILIGTLQDPITRDDDVFEPRCIAERAISYLVGTGVADQAKFATSCEFFILDELQFHRDADSSGWSSLSEATHDDHFDLRNAILEHLSEAEVSVNQHCSVDRTSKQVMDLAALSLPAAADAMQLFKGIVRRSVSQHKKVACFMPQPYRAGNGASTRCSFSLWRGEESLFGGQAFGGLSDLAMRALGGVLHHAPALMAFCNPTVNSYKRLYNSSMGTWMNGYSQTREKVVCRVSSLNNHPKSKSITCCIPDPNINPYVAYSAILMAAIDGIQNKLSPGMADVAIRDAGGSTIELPRSLWDALDRLESDMDFLVRGDVFDQKMIENWIEYKRDVERPAVESDPTPADFELYSHL